MSVKVICIGTIDSKGNELDFLRQCIEKTLEPVDHAVLDWKGIRSDHKSQLLSGLEAAGLAYVKV